jgi:hypothetical protein
LIHKDKNGDSCIDGWGWMNKNECMYTDEIRCTDKYGWMEIAERG